MLIYHYFSDMYTYIFVSQASICLLSSLPWLIKFLLSRYCCSTVDRSYRLFLMAANESMTIDKIMFVYKKPQILNTMMVFKQEFAVDCLKYN